MNERKVLHYFDNGYNCAEAVLLELKERFGVECKDIPKMGTPFGAGIGRTGRICGGLIGGIIMVGYLLGRKSNTKDKTYSNEVSSKLADEFEGEFGSVNCADISGIDWSNEESVDKYKEKVHYEVCHKVVLFVCDLLDRELKKYEEVI